MRQRLVIWVALFAWLCPVAPLLAQAAGSPH